MSGCGGSGLPGRCVLARPLFLPVCGRLPLTGRPSSLRIVYFEKIRVFKADIDVVLNTLAWDNGIGSCAYFVGF